MLENLFDKETALHLAEQFNKGAEVIAILKSRSETYFQDDTGMKSGGD